MSPSQHPQQTATDLDDRTLLAALRRGDTMALEQLFRAYMPRLCDYVYRYLHSRDEAQDVVQDLFATLWRTRNELTVTTSLNAYLYTAARNLALKRLRHDRVRATWREQQALHDAHEPDQAPPHDEALESAERHAEITRAVAELPERQRMVCVLRWMHGLPYATIAQQLGIGEATVETQLRRAIKTIRAKLGDSPQ